MPTYNGHIEILRPTVLSILVIGVRLVSVSAKTMYTFTSLEQMEK